MSREVAVPVDADTLPTLELDDLAQEGEAALVARGAAYAAEYGRIQGVATTLTKNLAVVVVALRVQHNDMRGSSHEYRQVVADMYRQTGMPPERLAALRDAVRWHVGNVLRRHMTPRELEANNLQPTSPLERLQDSRKTNSAIIKAAKASQAVTESKPKPSRRKAADDEPSTGTEIKATADNLRLASVVVDILGQLDKGVITKHMTPGQRAALDADLAKMERRIASLRTVTKKPRSKG
ncbi:hypothetical protein [Streptomyces sp. NPDC058542]|uniref:hypothetical protein n=1 Tax=Streptomyces sp. NPDC058542 TaxID=3346543 RepID=UPI003646F304